MNVEYTFRTLATQGAGDVIALPLPHHDAGCPGPGRSGLPVTDAQHEQTDARGERLHRCANAEELRRVVDSDTPFRAATRTSADWTSDLYHAESGRRGHTDARHLLRRRSGHAWTASASAGGWPEAAATSRVPTSDLAPGAFRVKLGMRCVCARVVVALLCGVRPWQACSSPRW